MSKLVTKGNLAIFEYPEGATKPTFTLDTDGVLWIEGYNFPFIPNGTPVRAMKRFETNLKGYTVIGDYDYAKQRIEGDFSDVIAGLNVKNCVVLIRKSTIEKP